MRITRHTDYALRLLMYLSLHGARTTVTEASEALEVSKHHLVKVAKSLGDLGYLELVRGKFGGISLALDPEEIRVGAVFRALERDVIVECFDSETNACVLSADCGLTGVFRSALEAFCERLDEVTLASLVRKKKKLRDALGLDRGAP